MTHNYLLLFFIGSLAAFIPDFGIIRIINRLEGSRSETPEEIRRSFTIGDKYFLPLAGGFEAIMLAGHPTFLASHLWLFAGSVLGLLAGVRTQWQTIRHDPEFAHKAAQWYHSLIASPIMVFVVILPLLAPFTGLGPWWAEMGALLGFCGWAWCVVDDLRHKRVY